MDEPSAATTLLAQHRIPIIDVAHITKELVCPIKACTRQAARKLHKALMETGYALLVNHGVSESKLHRAYCKLDTFCSLSEDQKVIPNQQSGDIRGNHYKPPGNKVPGKLHEYRHDFYVKDVDAESLPEKQVPGFTNMVGSLVDDFKSLASVILQFIAIGCGVDPSYFLQNHCNLMSDEDDTYFQMTYFPPMDDCKAMNEQPSLEMGDTGTFAIISQDSEVGLEVMYCNKWVPVGFLPGSLLLRAGLCLQKWTDGVYKPSCYRMVIPDDPSVLSRSRHCAILHIYPNVESHIEPLCIIKNDFHTYYQSEQKTYCSFRRAYVYLRRKIRQFCR